MSAGASLVHKAAGTYRGAVETLLEPVFRYVRPGLVYVLGWCDRRSIELVLRWPAGRSTNVRLISVTACG